MPVRILPARLAILSVCAALLPDSFLCGEVLARAKRLSTGRKRRAPSAAGGYPEYAEPLRLAHHFRPTLLHFCRRNIFLPCRKLPSMSKRVDNHCNAVAEKLVLGLS